MYAVKLQTFEGPLDVLLELIEKEKMDISDISLTRVTGQFLEYIRSVQEKDPHHISDFLVVAAKLVLIKSKTLLPFLEVSAEEEAEMTDLKEKLESYKKVKEVARAQTPYRVSSRIRPAGCRRVHAARWRDGGGLARASGPA